MHAFTGCDTVRAFAGKGKLCTMTILKANAEFKEAFAQLGVQWNLPPNVHVKLEEFVCKMHVPQDRPQPALIHCDTICSV